MRYKGSNVVTIVLTVLCLTACSTMRRVTTDVRSRTTLETRDTLRQQMVVMERDTLREVTTITVQTNERGDTVKVVQVTDLTRARNRDTANDRQEKRVERRDTVYVVRSDSIVVRDTSLQPPGASGFLTGVKWLMALIAALTVLAIALRLFR